MFGSEYKFDKEMEFAVKEKISATGDNFDIVTSEGEALFKGDGQFFSTREKILLLNAEGEAILTIQSKHMSLHGKYYICRGDSDDDDNRVFIVKPSHTFNALNALAGTVELINVEGEEEEMQFYIKRKEGITNKVYGVYNKNDNEIGEIARDQGFGGWITDRDHYRVTVKPNKDCALILACALCVDEVREEDD